MEEEKDGAAKQVAKEVANQAKQQAKKAVKEAIKEELMAAVKSLVANPYFWLVVGIIVAIVVLVAGGLYVIDLIKNATTIEAKNSAAGTSIEAGDGVFCIDKSIFGNYSYKCNELSEDEKNQIEDTLEKNGFDKSNFSEEEKAILYKLIFSNPEKPLDISQYETDEELKCLPLFFKAELVTQYPNLGGTGDLQGKVNILREGATEPLKYTLSDTFNKYVTDSNPIALQYFTLDTNDNIIIANQNTYTEKYQYSSGYPLNKEADSTIITITTKSIPYKNLIETYTIPFGFLQPLLVITKNPDFCTEIAKKVYDDTKINLKVYDNKTIITNNYKLDTVLEYNDKYTYYIEYDYKKDENTYKNIPYTYTDYEEQSSSNYNYTVTTTNETTTNTIAIESAETVFFSIEQKYKNISTPGTPNQLSAEDTVKPNTLEDTLQIYQQVGLNNTLRDNVRNKINQADSQKNITNIDFKIPDSRSYIERYLIKKTEKHTNTNTVDKNEYQADTGNSRKEFKGEGKNGFYDIFIKKKYDISKEHLYEVKDRLYKMIENNLGNSERFINIMKYIFFLYSGDDMGITEEDINKLLGSIITTDFSQVGNISPFGCSLTKEEFVELAKQYKKDNNTYQNNMAKYAGDFYDICTKNNVNPIIAYAHACLETGYGNAIPYNNYFGMAIYNGASSGSKYNTPADSIESYCKWVINNATIGTSAYALNSNTAKKWAKYNEKLSGTPDNNIYALYCRYAYLGDTHLCNEPDFDNPKGTNYYINNGSTWGAGGRIYIYEMYENGGLYSGEYKNRCGHSNSSDATTDQEKADYAVYTTNKRIEIAKAIFGNKVISPNNYGNGELSEQLMNAAEEIRQHCTTNRYTYNVAIPNYSEGVKSLWNKKGVCCASYVAWILAEVSPEYEALVNSCAFRGAKSLGDKLSEKFPRVASYEDMQAGDIIVWEHHVQMYAGNGYWYNGGASNSIPPVKYSNYDARSVFAKYGNYYILRPIPLD